MGLLTACGNLRPIISPPAMLYNKWQGFGYVFEGQSIDSRFALSGSSRSFRGIVHAQYPAVIDGFQIINSNVKGLRTVDVDWSVQRHGTINLNPLTLWFTSKKQVVSTSFGDWHLTVLSKQSPTLLQVTDQSVGDVFTSMQTTYDFFVTLHEKRPILAHSFRLITNAPSNYLNIKLKKMTLRGDSIILTGAVVLQNQTRQVELIPAVQYVAGNVAHIQPLWPMVMGIMPSPSTEKQFAEPSSQF